MAWRYNLGWTPPEALHAQPPPPGWTKTPLFVELSTLKQHVVTLSAENTRLSGLTQDLTETCGHLSKEVGRLKKAFSALADLVDSEVGRLESDGAKVRTQVTGLEEEVAALKKRSAHADEALAKEQERAKAAAGQVDEWMRGICDEVEDLRGELAGTSQAVAREAEAREAEARLLRRDLAEMQPPLSTLQYNVAACALELQRQQEELQRTATAGKEGRALIEEALHGTRQASAAAAGRSRPHTLTWLVFSPASRAIPRPAPHPRPMRGGGAGRRGSSACSSCRSSRRRSASRTRRCARRWTRSCPRTHGRRSRPSWPRSRPRRTASRSASSAGRASKLRAPPRPRARRSGGGGQRAAPPCPTTAPHLLPPRRGLMSSPQATVVPQGRAFPFPCHHQERLLQKLGAAEDAAEELAQRCQGVERQARRQPPRLRCPV